MTTPRPLTRDYLAELTMLILARARLKDPERGYAKTFLRQMEDCLGLVTDRGCADRRQRGRAQPGGTHGEATRTRRGKVGLPARSRTSKGTTSRRVRSS